MKSIYTGLIGMVVVTALLGAFVHNVQATERTWLTTGQDIVLSKPAGGTTIMLSAFVSVPDRSTLSMTWTAGDYTSWVLWLYTVHPASNWTGVSNPVEYDRDNPGPYQFNSGGSGIIVPYAGEYMFRYGTVAGIPSKNTDAISIQLENADNVYVYIEFGATGSTQSITVHFNVTDGWQSDMQSQIDSLHAQVLNLQNNATNMSAITNTLQQRDNWLQTNTTEIWSNLSAVYTKISDLNNTVASFYNSFLENRTDNERYLVYLNNTISSINNYTLYLNESLQSISQDTRLSFNDVYNRLSMIELYSSFLNVTINALQIQVLLHDAYRTANESAILVASSLLNNSIARTNADLSEINVSRVKDIDRLASDITSLYNTLNRASEYMVYALKENTTNLSATLQTSSNTIRVEMDLLNNTVLTLLQTHANSDQNYTNTTDSRITALERDLARARNVANQTARDVVKSDQDAAAAGVVGVGAGLSAGVLAMRRRDGGVPPDSQQTGNGSLVDKTSDGDLSDGENDNVY